MNAGSKANENADHNAPMGGGPIIRQRYDHNPDRSWEVPACQRRMIVAECPLYRPLLVSGPLHRVIDEGDCQCQTNLATSPTLSES